MARRLALHPGPARRLAFPSLGPTPCKLSHSLQVVRSKTAQNHREKAENLQGVGFGGREMHAEELSASGW
jgi:hypothetical protein